MYRVEVGMIDGDSVVIYTRNTTASERATAHLRFVKGRLQQKFLIETIKDDDNFSLDIEWREVPEVDDE
jgi:hypothetical protein